MLSGYGPEDDADALPGVGAIVPRGGEIEFGLPQSVQEHPEVFAHFDVIHPDGRVHSHAYCLRIGSERIGAHPHSGAPQTHLSALHLTQDDILLRDGGTSAPLPQ